MLPHWSYSACELKLNEDLRFKDYFNVINTQTAGRKSSVLCSCFTVMWFTASQSHSEMADEASCATPVWIESTIQSVSCDDTHISPHSEWASKPLCKAHGYISVKPMSAWQVKYWVILLCTPVLAPDFNSGDTVIRVVSLQLICFQQILLWEGLVF